MERRTERVNLETDRTLVSGELTLPAEGYGSRLSDHVNRRDVDFLVLRDATVTALADGSARSYPVVLVNLRHVRLIVPAGDDPASGSDG